MSKPEAANPHFKIYTSTVKQNPLYKKTKKSCRRNGSGPEQEGCSLMVEGPGGCGDVALCFTNSLLHSWL